MKIAVVGDVHCRINQMYEKVQKIGNIDVILQVGDLGTFLDISKIDKATRKHNDWMPDFSEYYNRIRYSPILTYFIKGNHEDFDFLRNCEKNRKIADNLFYIPNGSFANLNGLKIGAIGGCWSYDDYDCTRKELNGRRMRHFNYQDAAEIRVHKPDILLMHDCPTDVLAKNPEHGSPRLKELIEEIQPAYAFHGHHHIFNRAKIGRTEVIGLGMIDSEKEQSIYSLEI